MYQSRNLFISEIKLSKWKAKHDPKCPICKDSIVFSSEETIIYTLWENKDEFNEINTPTKAIRGKCFTCGFVLFIDFDVVNKD